MVEFNRRVGYTNHTAQYTMLYKDASEARSGEYEWSKAFVSEFEGRRPEYGHEISVIVYIEYTYRNPWICAGGKH